MIDLQSFAWIVDQVWAKLRQGQLLLFRDRKDSAEEMTIDLKGGTTIEVALYYTKRKHVLRLCTANGLCEHLLQCEDSNDMVLWLQHFNVKPSFSSIIHQFNYIFFFFGFNIHFFFSSFFVFLIWLISLNTLIFNI